MSYEKSENFFKKVAKNLIVFNFLGYNFQREKGERKYNYNIIIVRLYNHYNYYVGKRKILIDFDPPKK